jgi:hypothetical protein
MTPEERYTPNFMKTIISLMILTFMVSPAFARPTPNRNSPFVIEVVLQDNRHVIGEIHDRNGDLVSSTIYTAEKKPIQRFSEEDAVFILLQTIQDAIFNGYLEDHSKDKMVTWNLRWFSLAPERGEFHYRLIMQFKWVINRNKVTSESINGGVIALKALREYLTRYGIKPARQFYRQ